jgi:rhamnopyranosyl-N-acetylglucosaminyl-diphospho-decaprenol beta-1,3/1,4-galactofuranosyltransferase
VIAVVVLTHNRLHLLRRCVEDVLLRTSEKTREIVVWNNDSDDGTKEYLDTLTDPRIRVVHSPENIGMNAYPKAFALATQDYLVELDDDVIEAPPSWDETLLDAFVRLPEIGYLATSLVDDPNDSQALYLKYLREERNAYTRKQLNSVTILDGPAPGICAMTSRELYERVGGFKPNAKFVYWHEDAVYVKDLKRLGYGSAVLEGLSVWHAGGPYYSQPNPAKNPYHDHQARLNARKDFVKRLILRMPFGATLNARYNWFDPPHRYKPPVLGKNRS